MIITRPGGGEQELVVEAIVRQLRLRCEELFERQQYSCSEALIVALNQGLGGGLSPEVARRLGSGFCHGLGGAGCLCGALSGAELMVGLLLGPGQAGGLEKKPLSALALRLHEQFAARFGSSCCRVLTQEFGSNRTAQRQYCLELTGECLAMTARLLLAARPELAAPPGELPL